MQAIRSTLRSRAALSARSFSSSPAHSFARLTITGRLAAEPELSATSTGGEIVKYAVGTSSGPKDNRQTSWFRIASFAPDGPSRAHLLGLPKGSLVLVEGDVTMRNYEDAEGKRHSAVSIVQRNIEVLKRGTPSEEHSSE
ncbi:ssDNA binding protein, putative [Talaromyces islandicus]|uniref:SsDNA binding protein, putative n=1 Tax=Talaromyces islandicus TaxID=28573 RepID=A0A0U1LUW7_TALIS|nr:ssDNA binding protein, putative [Talaromyces islandicus]